MTAPTGNLANRFTGIREFGQVTNGYSGYLQSAGVLYNLPLPFQADRFDWFRYTAFGTPGILGQGVWFRDFPAGDTLTLRSIADNGATAETSQLLETTNGITVANLAGGFTDQHLVISGISGPATPPIVTTSTDHHLTDGDRVVITKVIGTMAEQINNNTYVVKVLAVNTFSLYDTFGIPISIAGTYTSSGQVTKIVPFLGDVNQPVSPAVPHKGIINYPPIYRLALGTSVMGADNDIIYFTAWQFNNYVNIGDVV